MLNKFLILAPDRKLGGHSDITDSIPDDADDSGTDPGILRFEPWRPEGIIRRCDQEFGDVLRMLCAPHITPAEVFVWMDRALEMASGDLRRMQLLCDFLMPAQGISTIDPTLAFVRESGLVVPNVSGEYVWAWRNNQWFCVRG